MNLTHLARIFRGNPISVVVPVSGGKDSQACLKLALQEHDAKEVLGLFCDTQFEHPKTYEHIQWLRENYCVKIMRITAGNVPDKVVKHKRFPSGIARFCTDQLKIIPSKVFYGWLVVAQECGFEVWYGVRSDESREREVRYRGKVCDEVYEPHEFMKNYPKKLGNLGVRFRLPVVEWTYQDVMEYLAGEENPLYRSGFDRVGCFPCLAGGDAAKIRAFEFDEFGRQQYETVKRLEVEIGKSVFTSGKGACWEKEGAGCSFCSI